MKICHATKLITLVLLAAIASANIAASEIYHWVDEDGVSHFSQQPPAKDIQNVSTQPIRDTAPSVAQAARAGTQRCA